MYILFSFQTKDIYGTDHTFNSEDGQKPDINLPVIIKRNRIKRSKIGIPECQAAPVSDYRDIQQCRLIVGIPDACRGSICTTRIRQTSESSAYGIRHSVFFQQLYIMCMPRAYQVDIIFIKKRGYAVYGLLIVVPFPSEGVYAGGIVKTVA